MDDEVVLTLGIITYNQREQLRRLLLGVMPQMQPGVEIVINDNSRNTETEEMVKSEFNSPCVRYFRNENNIEFDGNVLIAIERARGKYVWWLGDDEIKPGGIAHVLNIIKEHHDISLFWINFITSDGVVPARDFGQDKLFKDRNEVLKQISNELGFVSSAILKKEKASNIDKNNMNQFMGLGFINVYVFMHVLSQEGKFYYVNEPYVICHPASTEGTIVNYNGFKIFGVYFYRIINNFKDKFEQKSIKKMLAKNFGHVWRGTLVGWMMGIDSPRGKALTMLKLYWNYPEVYMALPFFLLPKFVTKFFYFIYKKVLGRSYRPVNTWKTF